MVNQAAYNPPTSARYGENGECLKIETRKQYTTKKSEAKALYKFLTTSSVNAPNYNELHAEWAQINRALYAYLYERKKSECKSLKSINEEYRVKLENLTNRVLELTNLNEACKKEAETKKSHVTQVSSELQTLRQEYNLFTDASNTQKKQLQEEKGQAISKLNQEIQEKLKQIDDSQKKLLTANLKCRHLKKKTKSLINENTLLKQNRKDQPITIDRSAHLKQQLQEKESLLEKNQLTIQDLEEKCVNVENQFQKQTEEIENYKKREHDLKEQVEEIKKKKQELQNELNQLREKTSKRKRSTSQDKKNSSSLREFNQRRAKKLRKTPGNRLAGQTD